MGATMKNNNQAAAAAGSSVGSSGRRSMSADHNEGLSELAMEAREEEIERKKMEVRDKVEYQLSRAEEETRRLAHIWEELEMLTDPMRKEVATLRKKIDITNRELKTLGQNCQKKEKEYKEVLDAFQEKSKEKAQLTTALMELVNESEKVRMRKLEELNKIVDPSY